MSATCPFPDRLEDGMVNRVKDRFADDMAVIERPSAYLRIECYDQLASREARGFL